MTNSETSLHKDTIFLNLIFVFLLAVVAVVLLYSQSIGSFVLFIFTALLLLNMIAAYNLGLQRGLMLAIVLTFVYGSYIIYQNMSLRSGAEVSFGYMAWMFFFPLGSLLSGQLSQTVSGYKREVAAKRSLEKLVTIDISTGLYNHQGFFKKFDEEFLRAKRYRNKFVVMLIKISNFDELQVIYGEIDSVKILQAISDKVVAQTRFSDVKSLIQGHMLSVLLPETDEAGARIVVEKLHQAIDTVTVEINSARKVIRIKPSIGIGCIREGDADAMEMYERAKEELNYDRG